MVMMATQTAHMTPASSGFAHRDDCPLDLVHLAKQTLGDRSLEHEVLGLFVKQAVVYMARVEEAVDADARFAAVHTIKGSARNIGAWAVAASAASIETASAAELADDIADLKSSLVLACDFIRTLLEDA